jgi:hypothetical protein
MSQGSQRRPGIVGKDLELLREAFPRSAILPSFPTRPGPNQAPMITNVKIAARSLGGELLILEARGPDQKRSSFELTRLSNELGHFRNWHFWRERAVQGSRIDSRGRQMEKASARQN